MANTGNKINRYGLVGKNISYSFSRGYFAQKFTDMGLDNHSYENFDLQHIEEFPEIIRHTKGLMGLNITIPYKEEVMPFLTGIDDTAKQIGAVNTIKLKGRELIGYNTDAHGFQKSLEPFLAKHHGSALILGTGGASKAVAFVLGQLGITFRFVSRNPIHTQLGYKDIDKDILQQHQVIVNCTPLGTYPNIKQKPALPYECLNKGHLLYDLIYNPAKTAFLLEGESRGATICNGLRMLELQAEKAWEIWNG
ncbi:shikimate dehydrogenase [Ulvibacterium sp.]|uniref:shikimate dehydrogenase family protein n=1 Tax=Ulvibacterium sp. TaxID=2665914 RepID=UPI002629A7B8|nr:shikimate dehydrogenase [Ulvibacterium sp.]